MALYKPSHSNVYQTRFQVKGKMFRKSTGETDINRARKFETDFRKECRLAAINKTKEGIKAHRALDEFLATKKDSDNCKNYEKHVGVCKKFFFSKLYLHEVTFDQLEKLAAEQKAQGYANATVNHRLQTLSSAITLARKRGFKVPDLTIPKMKATKGRTRMLTDEEFESIKVQLRDMTVFKSDKYGRRHRPPSARTLRTSLSCCRVLALAEPRSRRWNGRRSTSRRRRFTCTGRRRTTRWCST